MAINFSDVLNKTGADIERPPLPPVGTYRWRITKLPEQSTTTDGAWDIVNFSVRAVSAEDDVDLDDYKGEVTNILQSVRFMFNKNDDVEFEKSLFRMKQFLINHVKCAEESDSVGQMLNKSVNGEFLGVIAWRPDKNDADNMFANISRTAPLD